MSGRQPGAETISGFLMSDHFRPLDQSLALSRCQIAESGGPGEELPCSTVALAPMEPVAKSGLDRVRCGAPLRLGRITAPQVKTCFYREAEVPGISAPL